jgi:hypothetical protein
MSKTYHPVWNRKWDALVLFVFVCCVYVGNLKLAVVWTEYSFRKKSFFLFRKTHNWSLWKYKIRPLRYEVDIMKYFFLLNKLSGWFCFPDSRF